MLPPLGFIALEIFFTRPVGDPWNSATWPFPLIRETARGSSEKEVVTESSYDSIFIDRFVECGRKLAEKGCIGIITSCGFLAMAQDELASRLPIPIATSSLVQLPSVLSILPRTKSIGVLTYDAQKLGTTHLEALGVGHALNRIYIHGAPTRGHLQKLVQDDAPYVHADIAAELEAVAVQMKKDIPNLGALVLECTQMSPFSEGIQKALGGSVPVYDIHTMGLWFYSGLVSRTPRRWNTDKSDCEYRKA